MSSVPPPDPLSSLLRTWTPLPRADPAFRASVWRRIDLSRSETWSTYLRRRYRSWALATVALVLMGGVGAQWIARARLESERDHAARSYLVGLDPRVQARLSPR